MTNKDLLVLVDTEIDQIHKFHLRVNDYNSNDKWLF